MLFLSVANSITIVLLYVCKYLERGMRRVLKLSHLCVVSLRTLWGRSRYNRGVKADRAILIVCREEIFRLATILRVSMPVLPPRALSPVFPFLASFSEILEIVRPRVASSPAAHEKSRDTSQFAIVVCFLSLPGDMCPSNSSREACMHPVKCIGKRNVWCSSTIFDMREILPRYLIRTPLVMAETQLMPSGVAQGIWSEE